MPSPSCTHSTTLRYAIYRECNESVADRLLFINFLLKSVKMFSYLFRCLTFQSNLFPEKQNRPVLMEAKNSAPYIWALMEQTELVVQPAIFLGSIDPKAAGFVLGKRARRRR